MIISLKMDTAALAELEAKLATLCSSAAQRLAQEMANELLVISELNFGSGAQRPAPWPPLAESTIAGFSAARRKAQARREKQAASRGQARAAPRPLIDTGTLVRSLGVKDVSAAGASLTSTQHYAPYHQFGSLKRPGRPPARPFVPVTGEPGGELQPTAAAEKRMLRAAEAALRVAASQGGFKV